MKGEGPGPPAPFRWLPAAALAVLALAATAPAHPQSKEELSRLRGRLEALQKELAASEESRSEAEDALRESERAISDANRELAELARQAREANAGLERLQAEGRALQGDIASQQQLLLRLLRQQYLGGQQEYLRLLVAGADPNQVARDLHYLGHLARARAQWLEGLRGKLRGLEQNTRHTREQAQRIAAIVSEQAAQKRRLEQEKAQRKQVLAALSRQVGKQKREIGKLKRDEARLARLVEKLGTLLSRPDAPRLANTRLPEASHGSAFREQRGQLALPVRGELANRFGSPRSDGGTTWKGLFIRSPEGDAVKAVAAGRVVFADWLRGFGNLLILDHGAGYMSLYGNNETLYRRLGDGVAAGETVAAVGNSGGNPESGVYFELRHEGRPLDPLDWVKLR